MTLQIEEGCFYRTREGHIVGPIERGSEFWPWGAKMFGRKHFWQGNGSFYWAGQDQRDLVEKVVNPSESIPSATGNILLTDETSALKVGNEGAEGNDSKSLEAETLAPLDTILTMRATEIAGRAADLVGGDRDRQHGQKLDNFARIATMWNAWLTTRRDPAAPLSAHDVGIMMAAMKMARTQSGALNLDDYVDLCGYAACAGELAQQQS